MALTLQRAGAASRRRHASPGLVIGTLRSGARFSALCFGARACALAVGVLGLLSLQCETNNGERAQQNRALVENVRRLREAPNSEKAPRLRALERTACSKPLACDVKRTCVEAYRAHVRAVTSVETAKRAMESGTADASVGLLLVQAEDLLRAALAETERCSSLEGKLRSQSATR